LAQEVFGAGSVWLLSQLLLLSLIPPMNPEFP
jgi:hypothetical protein